MNDDYDSYLSDILWDLIPQVPSNGSAREMTYGEWRQYRETAEYHHGRTKGVLRLAGRSALLIGAALAVWGALKCNTTPVSALEDEVTVVQSEEVQDLDGKLGSLGYTLGN